MAKIYNVKMITLNCPVCKKDYDKRLAYHNVAIKRNAKEYCSHNCFGVGRKLEFDKHLKTPEQLKAEKAEYDREFRKKNAERLKKEKADFFQKDYKANPEKYKAIRQKRMPQHVEYCRQPEYKAKKVEYDKEHRAKKNYGEYWEAHLLTDKIASLIDNREIKQQQGLTNKTKKRKQEWKTLMQNH